MDYRGLPAIHVVEHSWWSIHLSGDEAKIYELCVIIIAPILLWLISANPKSDRQLWVVLCSWCATSVGMQVLNKALVNRLQAPCFIATCQMAMTAIIFGLLHGRQIYGTFRAQPSQFWWWIPASVTFGGVLLTSIFIYKYITLSDMTVVRTVAPIVALPIEALIMPLGLRPKITLSTIGAMAVMLLGAVIYGLGAPAISRFGIAWASLNSCIVVLDRFVQRRLLSVECKNLKLEECVFMSNLFGLLAAIGPAIYFDNPFQLHGKIDLPVVALLISSGIVGSCICYLGLSLQRSISATTSLVVQNVSRIAIFGVGVIYFGDTMNSSVCAGIGCALLGSLWYGHELLQQVFRRAHSGEAAIAWEEETMEETPLVRGKGTGKGAGSRLYV